MNLLLGITNFILSTKQIGRGLREEKALYLFAGLAFALASGIYFYLSLREGEIEVSFGDDAELED